MTKLGLHANRMSSQLLPFVRDAKPRIVKFLDHDIGTVQACRAASPHTIFIGRFFTSDMRFQNPKRDAQNYVAQLLPVADRMRGLYEAWESYNELNPPTPDEARLFNEFHVHFAEQMHAHGLKTVAYNFSTGNPDLSMWKYYQDGAQASDYIGLHEYDAPALDATGGMYLTLRYRRVWNQLRPSARKPIIITECGIDGGVGKYAGPRKSGYKDFKPERTVAQYMQQLQWYDDELNKDNYLLGACIFCFGADSSRWESFDIADDDEALSGLKRIMTRSMAPAPSLPPPQQPRKPPAHHPPAPQPPAHKPPDSPISQTPTYPGPSLPDSPISQTPTYPGPSLPDSPISQTPTYPGASLTPALDRLSDPKLPPEQACRIPVAGWFGARYAADEALRSALGCPSGPAQTVAITEQRCQHGVLIRRGDNGRVSVLLSRGTWSDYADALTTGQQAANVPVPPAGLIEPRQHFGNVWRDSLGRANSWLGFAIEEAHAERAAIQPFEHGTVIHADRGSTFILKAERSWQT
jgi:hypothetical protein